ncbi:ABC transporter permease [Sinomicrobium sp. M5D2P17]
MIKNYFKIAWRNLLKNKMYSGINIGGLAMGITACLLILQYVSYELSYDDFHTEKDRIFRVKQDRFDDGKLASEWAAGAFAVGNSFHQAIPEIEDYVKVVETRDAVLNIDNAPLKTDKVFYAGSSFFKIFSYPLLTGNPEKALTAPFTAVISESTALKIFGHTAVTGQSIRINNDRNYKITGVFKDMPQNTQLKPNILLSYSSFIEIVKADSKGEDNPETWWVSDGCLTYLLLQKGADPKKVEAKFPPVVAQGVGEIMKQMNASVNYVLQPLTDIHLDPHYRMEPGTNGNRKTVYLLMGVAFFIVIIAWINYINLATARAIGRAKEVGVRKVIGSKRKQLIAQFFTESSMFNGLAVVLSILLMIVIIPLFHRISGLNISYSLFVNPVFWSGLCILYMAGTFFSGFYPALVLSRFKPVEVLKGRMTATRQGGVLRKSLVVFQFAASLLLLINSLIVYRQIQFMQNQSLGINIDQTLVIRPPVVSDSTFIHKKKAFKEFLLQNPSIKHIAVSSTVPGKGGGGNAGGIRLVTQDESRQKQYRVLWVDHDYTSLLDIKMVAGRPFSEEHTTDKESVIFNRLGIQQLGFNNPEEAIGRKINFWGDQFTIVGVSENFHQESLRQAYEPLILRLTPEVAGYFALKLGTDQIAQTIQQVHEAWNRFFPGNTYEYFFLDDGFAEQYRADRQFGSVFFTFTVFAILIACLGLFGLASYNIMLRTKEIGIRKVLGASVGKILKLLYKEFAILLSLAFLISLPLTWLMASNWLQGYAFRIDIHWAYFVLPFVVMILITSVTVSFQTIKASLANPVKNLRTE